MTLDELREEFGSLYRVSQILNVRQQNTTKWVRAGRLPGHWQDEIERMTNGKLKADPNIPRYRQPISCPYCSKRIRNVFVDKGASHVHSREF